MINFFRKKRKKMADDNKTFKYMRYAIGEIVLVVIGILIALQINAWNKDRISKIEEKGILKNIHSEFLQNDNVIKETLKSNILCYDSSVFVFELIGLKRDELIKYNIDSLIFLTLETNIYRPSENTISDLLQSGKLQLLHNENLKNLFYQWNRAMKSYESSALRKENIIDDKVLTYLYKNYSLKDIDKYGQLKWESNSHIKIDKLKIFEDIEFENIMDDYLYRLVSEQDRLKELEVIIDNIIKETE